LGPCIPADFTQYPNGISPDAAEQLLFKDPFKNAMLPIKFLVSVPLAQKEFDALSDFTFNIGPELVLQVFKMDEDWLPLRCSAF
jgi:hypothetical protein